MAPSSHLPDVDSLWNYNDPAGTEAMFRDLLPAARASGDPGYLAELLTQIARTLSLQRRFEAAHATLDEVKELLPAATPRAQVRYLLERGRTFNSSRRLDEAKEQFLAAWHLALEANEEGFAVDAAHMMAIAEPGQAGLDWNLTALDLAERSLQEAAQRWKGSLLNNIGWSYHDMGRYEEALDVFQRGVSEQQRLGRAEEKRIAEWTVARALRSLGRVEEALVIQQRLLASGPSEGYSEEEIGECLLALGRAEEAAPYFARTYEKLGADPWLQENEPERIARWKELGGITE
jgi:tetratricopeptide (TPR) repeat protein